MKIIGLTGGSGCGKGEICNILSKLNVFIVDTDKIYKEICVKDSEILNELVLCFSADILDKKGELNRKVLASKAFSDENNHNMLNKITHKYILKETVKKTELAKNYGFSAVVIDAPLLFESEFDKLCCTTISVLSKKQTRVKRIIKRDNISKEAALMRINSQPDDNFYISASDYIIRNDGNLDILKQSVLSVWHEITGIG